MRKSQLDAMVADATVDCYDEDEQVGGLFNMIEENLQIPFETTVLGVDVSVERVELRDGGRIVAVCSRGESRQAISLLDLPLPPRRLDGAEWIAAYRHWAH